MRITERKITRKQYLVRFEDDEDVLLLEGHSTRSKPFRLVLRETHAWQGLEIYPYQAGMGIGDMTPMVHVPRDLFEDSPQAGGKFTSTQTFILSIPAQHAEEVVDRLAELPYMLPSVKRARMKLEEEKS